MYLKLYTLNVEPESYMAEPLKNQYGPEIPEKIAGMIAGVYDGFDSPSFMKDVLDGYEELELKPRAKRISTVLHKYLPQAYEEAISILLASCGEKLDNADAFGMGPFMYLPHIIFVADYGLDHFEASMHAQYELTQRFTAEFSIRAYLEAHTERTLARLREWTTDESQHVRRLVSEGTRPRLPWASRLRAFQKDPSPVIELLELLKDDPELYVRRSVANNLNDISKDHPELVVEIANRWMDGASEERQWVVRHALRTLVKQGHAEALLVLGYGDAGKVAVLNPSISPENAKMDEAVIIAFDLKNEDNAAKKYMIDFRIHYIKANGKANPKVFKMKSATLEAGEVASFQKKVSLKEMTTRKHYPGRHAVDVIINGHIEPIGAFELT